MPFQFTIIIPVLNEEDIIHRLENVLLNYMETSTADIKVLFIDDGSTDNSLSYIETICKDHPDFSFISFDKNYGLSTALKAGFDHTNTEILGYIDADLQTVPEDFELLLNYISEYDLVTGVRSHRHDSFTKRMASRTANYIRNLFTKDGMNDTGCPLKVIKTKYAKQIPMFRGLHRFLPAMILLQGGTIKQVPVRHFPRTTGTSKFGIGNRFFGPLLDCFAYLWMKNRTIDYTIKKQQL